MSKFVQTVECESLPAADVVVAGAGTAGVIAAIAAARSGAKTVLVEQSGTPGGMLTSGNAGVTMFTKYSGKREDHDQDEETLKHDPKSIQLVGGIPRELAERLIREGIGQGNAGTFSSYLLTSSEAFKQLLFQMLREAGVQLLFHTFIADAIRENDRVTALILESKSGRQYLPAKAFVDATGDGDVAAKAKVPFSIGITEEDECAASYKLGTCCAVGVMYKVANVDLAKMFKSFERDPDGYIEHPFSRFTLAVSRRNFEAGENCSACIRFSEKPEGWFQFYNTPDKGIVTIGCPCVQEIDGLNAGELTRAEMEMADLVKRWTATIRAEIPGFENCVLIDCPEICVRETRHIKGEYTLNLYDAYHNRHFDDCIGFGAHPFDVEPRPAWLAKQEDAYPPRWSFEIPYRSLVASGIDNLLVAGRCISATHEAFGSIRTTVQCMITGEAAGTAAAMTVQQGIAARDLPAQELRSTLKANGVWC